MTPAERARAARNSLNARGDLGPKNRGRWVGSIYFRVRAVRARLDLEELYVEPEARGQGLASRALRWITSTADQQRVPVRVRVCPYGPRHARLRAEKLREWYEAHGFQAQTGPWMVRPPAK